MTATSPPGGRVLDLDRVEDAEQVRAVLAAPTVTFTATPATTGQLRSGSPWSVEVSGDEGAPWPRSLPVEQDLDAD